jgi:hypothetical protein
MAATKPVAAAPAAKTSETVHEFVLYRRSGDERAPVMSDHDLDVVKAAKIDEINAASREGRPRPALFITDRKCTYPLRNGKRQADGSTCDESEV